MLSTVLLCTVCGELHQGNSTTFFEAIMRNATAWGGVTYEQDWLDFESDEVVA